MRFLKKALVILGLFLVVAVILLWGFMHTLTPTYEGEQPITGLQSQVTTYYDPYGIPHIYAENNEDAFQVLGYVHAQDRLWQMELLRRIAKGGLSEVFGSDKMLETDKFFLTLGIDDHSKTAVMAIDKDTEMYRWANAYLKGVNTFIAEGPTPVEFYLTGLDKSEFTLEDVFNTMGYMAFSFAMAHKTDPLLTNIKNKLGEAYLKDLVIDSDTTSVFIKNFNPDELDTIPNTITSAVHKALEKLPVPQFIGSNSWVIAPKKTKSGNVILANDPHIGFAQPSVWYEAHLSTPTYEKYGYHIAGVPFPLLAHDRNLAFGLTMFQNDDLDFYYEQNHATDSMQYKVKNQWEKYEWVDKYIVDKTGDTIPFGFKKSRHGPIVNGIAKQITDNRPIAMSWVYTQIPNEVMYGLFQMNTATNLEEFQQGLPKIHAPGLNVMYGDAKGNVAWWATAKLYEMPDSISTKFILNGATGEEERLRFLDFKQNPQAINPPWNYVYSANNQPDSILGRLYPGYYLPENRAKRIVQLLELKNDWDRESVSNMVLDVTSSVNPTIVTDFIKAIDISKFSEEQLNALDILKNWNGTYTKESIGSTLYHRCEYFALKNIFEDEMGPELFKDFLDTHLMKRQVVHGPKKQYRIWRDNIQTPNIEENMSDMATKSFGEAWSSLEKDFGNDITNWKWENVHSLEHQHPMGQVDALRSYFNVGPFKVNGSREVINNMAFPYDSTGYYKVSAGPSTRRIVDFSDIENSISILPTGQSGNPLSRYYKDQAQMFVNGEFRKMMMNKQEIMEKANSRLEFLPVSDE